MAAEGHGFWRSRTFVDVFAFSSGLVLVALWLLTADARLLIVGGYAILIGTSTTVVTFGLVQFTGKQVGSSTASRRRGIVGYVTGDAIETESDVQQDTGWLLGRLENVIVLSLVFVGAFTALSIVFAAKSFVRREDISSEDTAYYLAGTLLNFTYSIVVGFVVLELLPRGSIS